MDSKKILPSLMVLFGLGLIIASQPPSITGAAIGLSDKGSVWGAIIGLLMMSLGASVFGRPILASYQKPKKQQPQRGPVWKPGLIQLTSQIKRDSGLVRIAQEATRDETIEREMRHLTEELSRGHLNAGLGRPGHVEGTDIFYLRGRNGARLFYHKLGNGYEIVGKSSKDISEDQVIARLRKIYGR